MKLDCVLSACDLNPIYLDYIPLFIKTWIKLYPSIDVKVVLISKEIPSELYKYSNNIILFEPIEDLLTSFTAQYIRLLYPAILNYENGVMITDIDMIPMNSKYYTENIKEFDNKTFIYYRNVLLNERQISMCYNVASPIIWSEIFNIKNIEDITNRLIDVNKKINYIGKNGEFWYTDQVELFREAMNWNNSTQKFIYLDDNKTGFNRFPQINYLNDELISKIKSGYYNDFHLQRTYQVYGEYFEMIYNLL